MLTILMRPRGWHPAAACRDSVDTASVRPVSAGDGPQAFPPLFASALDISPATTDADEREHGSHHECQPTPDLVCEKVRGPQYFHVDTVELPPGHGVCALQSGRNAV